MALGWPRPPRHRVVSGLVGTLHAEGEVGLALAVDLGVEHLVLEVDGSLRLEVDVRAGGFDDLIVLARSWRGRDLQRTRVGRSRGGRDPQAGPFGRLRGR